MGSIICPKCHGGIMSWSSTMWDDDIDFGIRPMKCQKCGHETTIKKMNDKMRQSLQPIPRFFTSIWHNVRWFLFSRICLNLKLLHYKLRGIK